MFVYENKCVRVCEESWGWEFIGVLIIFQPLVVRTRKRKMCLCLCVCWLKASYATDVIHVFKTFDLEDRQAVMRFVRSDVDKYQYHTEQHNQEKCMAKALLKGSIVVAAKR